MSGNPSPPPENSLQIVVERNPSESRLAELNIKCWPKYVLSFSPQAELIEFEWGCPPGKYQLKFDAEETCYLVKGKVKVHPKGSSSSSSSGVVEFGAGDLVTIPKGLSCTWDVSVAVDKYYIFESNSASSSSSS